MAAFVSDMGVRVTQNDLSIVDSTQKNPLGLIARGYDASGNSAEFIYLKGVGSTIVGSVVTYTLVDGTTTLIVADACGPVAVALSINNAATTFGWYGITGLFPTDVVANSLAAAAGGAGIGRETTNGKVGDGRAAGDEICNMFQRVTTTAAAVVNCQLNRPFVNNFTGA